MVIKVILKMLSHIGSLLVTVITGCIIIVPFILVAVFHDASFMLLYLIPALIVWIVQTKKVVEREERWKKELLIDKHDRLH